MSKIRYAAVREGTTHAFIENDEYTQRRWNLVYPITDDLVTIKLSSVDHKNNTTVNYKLDLEKLTLTRDDGTVFDLVLMND
ncbi:hypothetical protein POV22_22500 [Klebsiella pneumoniae]|uniref:hypothetical protein n=1 Tax=Klebsiella TaxID=570 RepID=UPI00058FF625|nr:MULTISPECIES: hypothetical protein [Klebsiella]HDG7742428.1 hypothetical protein [Klebsiella quasipneumoniae]MBV5417968.1 hypothetical protein [Klebsiella pneumoniae]MCU8683442.1 hypothetical protein [Klebsiella pneumoniae]MCU8707228.1 hypothetical protein [Klebsiella pneumoniae]MCZ3404235.1 hypothetical protein [Klebsiella pneumoniae]